MSSSEESEVDPQVLRAKLNGETARIAWRELQRHFAAGSVIAVAPALDLLDAALAVARDDKAAVEQWLSAGLLAPASDDQAAEWHDANAAMWSVVVRPFVLVQPILAADN